MTTKELAKLIDTPYSILTKGLVVNVTILDDKMSWGRVLVQVTPVAGRGAIWVAYDGPLGADDDEK